MTEVHTTTVTKQEWYSSRLTGILELRGFKVSGEKLLGAVTCEPRGDRMVKVTQEIKEEEVAPSIGARSEFEGKLTSVTLDGEKIGLGNEDKELAEDIEEAKRLVAKLGKAVERYEGEKIVVIGEEQVAGAMGVLANDPRWARQQKAMEDQKKREQAEGIEFQKIWRIEEKEFLLKPMDVFVATIIRKGARHTDGKLDGVVGYDWQDGYVVVVQTVLVSECSVSGTNE